MVKEMGVFHTFINRCMKQTSTAERHVQENLPMNLECNPQSKTMHHGNYTMHHGSNAVNVKFYWDENRTKIHISRKFCVFVWYQKKSTDNTTERL